MAERAGGAGGRIAPDRTARRLAALCLLGMLAAAEAGAVEIENGVSARLAAWRAANIGDIEYQLAFDIPESKSDPIEGRKSVSFDLKDAAELLQLDFKAPPANIRSVIVNGAAVEPRIEKEHLVIASGLASGRNTIAIDFIAGDQSLNRNPEHLYTLFVPDRARTAFPCFDQPDLKARYTLELDIPADWTAVANGKLREKAAAAEAGRQVLRFAPTEPLSTYLFAFAAGRFMEIARERDGRRISLYHRETDQARLDRNVDAIFAQVFSAMDWMESYTGVRYPFAKYDFVLVPSFQYGGMEHSGATFYNDSRMLLNENPTQDEELARTELIAHETAHMWFGDDVTMRWFDDVWMKEVFAGFFADKIVEPLFPGVNHRLRFLLAHAPRAYAEDRSDGTNPIRQPLDNLKDAGTLYGGIIYHKSPMVMRMLEKKVGEEALQSGLQEYLRRFAYGNATWNDLVAILVWRSPGIEQWSDVWITGKGMPVVSYGMKSAADFTAAAVVFHQADPWGLNRVWEQPLAFQVVAGRESLDVTAVLDAADTEVGLPKQLAGSVGVFPNIDGESYGTFRLSPGDLRRVAGCVADLQPPEARASMLVNLYEALVNGELGADEMIATLSGCLEREDNPLIIAQLLDGLVTAFNRFRAEIRPDPRLEKLLLDRIAAADRPQVRIQYFRALSRIALTPEALDFLYQTWAGTGSVPGLKLSEDDLTTLCFELAVRRPERAAEIIATQRTRITNPDRLRRFDFIASAVDPRPDVREAFFQDLRRESNREMEPWVVAALRYLNHPLRQREALAYLPVVLELLPEIQATGDIFFPNDWIAASFAGHSSREAAAIVVDYLDRERDLPDNLRRKLLINTWILRKQHGLVK